LSSEAPPKAVAVLARVPRELELQRLADASSRSDPRQRSEDGSPLSQMPNPTSIASKDRFHVVPIRVENKGCVIVITTQARRPVGNPASFQRGRIECVNLRTGFCRKCCVLPDRVRMITVDPEDGIICAVADPVRANPFGDLHNSPQTECAESRVIKDRRTTYIGDPNPSMINH